MIESLLERLGFSPGEVRTYLALLKLKESTIGPLAKEAGVTPAKTYLILDRLKEKGLVSETISSGTKHFRVLNTKRLLDLVDEREQHLRQLRGSLEEELPKLTRGPTEEYYSLVYEGYEGMKNLYDEAMRLVEETGGDFIGFTLGTEHEYEQAFYFFKRYDLLRKERGIRTRLIGLNAQKDFLVQEYPERGIAFRFVDHGLPLGVIIYGDNVATLLWRETPRAFVIHSKETAHAYRSFFEDLWARAQP